MWDKLFSTNVADRHTVLYTLPEKKSANMRRLSQQTGQLVVTCNLCHASPFRTALKIHFLPGGIKGMFWYHVGVKKHRHNVEWYGPGSLYQLLNDWLMVRSCWWRADWKFQKSHSSSLLGLCARSIKNRDSQNPKNGKTKCLKGFKHHIWISEPAGSFNPSRVNLLVHLGSI